MRPNRDVMPSATCSRSLALAAAALLWTLAHLPSSGPVEAQSLSWVPCSGEGGICHISQPGKFVVRYGAQGRFYYNDVHVPANRTLAVACNHHFFGDPYYGVVKGCAYAPVADDTMPYTTCAHDGGHCASYPGGKPRLMRYGHPHLGWVYGMSDKDQPLCWPSTFRWDPFYGTLKQCQLGPVLDVSGWTACATENQTCHLPKPQSVALVRYGHGSHWTYRRVTSPALPCTNYAFGEDPIYGTVKRCEYLYEQPSVHAPVGAWRDAGSCFGCTLDRTLEWGVTSTSETSKTEEWIEEVTTTVEAGFDFEVFSIGTSVSVTQGHSTAIGLTSSLSHNVSQSCNASCGSQAGNYRLFQWVMGFEEDCFLQGRCGFEAFTCHFLCLTDPSLEPRCPQGCCADTACQTCRPECGL